MKRFLFCYLFYLVSLNAFAAGTLTTLLPELTLYSEYYANPSAKFKGTIIFINGSGADISEWKSNTVFFNCVKKTGSVFFYDRPGVGQSPFYLQYSPKKPLTAKLGSEHLLMLLTKLKIKKPWILVAHSYGALYAGYFSLKNPDSVKGLLLVDPAPRNFNYSTAGMSKFEKGIVEAKTKSSHFIYNKYKGPEAEILYQLTGFEQSRLSISQAGSINDNIPVIILSSLIMEKLHPLKEDWFESQKQWLNQNPMSKITQVSAEHFIQLQQPRKVCEELKKLTARAKTS